MSGPFVKRNDTNHDDAKSVQLSVQLPQIETFHILTPEKTRTSHHNSTLPELEDFLEHILQLNSRFTNSSSRLLYHVLSEKNTFCSIRLLSILEMKSPRKDALH